VQALVADRGVTLRFPTLLTFHAHLRSAHRLHSIMLEYGVIEQTCGSVTGHVFPDIGSARDGDVAWTWDMRQSGSEPPGATIWYRWRATDMSGATFTTPTYHVTWIDHVHPWHSISRGMLTLHWYQGPPGFARTLLQSASGSLDRLERSTGVAATTPINMYIYPTSGDLLDAILYLPGWTGGEAYATHNIVAIGIGTSQVAWGRRSMAHELTHVLIGHLDFSCLEQIPTWLNEGIAVYNEGVQHPVEDAAIRKAAATNHLLSIRSLSGAFSEVQSTADLSYAESYSLVRYLLATRGSATLHRLFLRLRDGLPIAAALRDIYGFGLDELERRWRISVGAPVQPPGSAASLPLAYPTPDPAYQPLTWSDLTPRKTAAPAGWHQSRRVAVPSYIFGPDALDALPYSETLYMEGGESSDPRAYDPATGGTNAFLYSGLVSFDAHMRLVPELAASWDINRAHTVYTFHLRRNARFHDGRPVTALDVIYSWERAAAPATASPDAPTYLGDIVGLADMHAGHARHIRGLKALDRWTLRVTIDGPKPYFLEKLTYGVADVVDRANVESGPDWYRHPNGTGPYRLVRWVSGRFMIYMRNDDFYRPPPGVRYVAVLLYAGVPLDLFEGGQIDLAPIRSYDAQRFQDPRDPLHADLRQGISLCTSKVTMDVAQAPFDDPRVRQAFSLATDRRRYIDVVLSGEALPARGLYPPGLPGYDPRRPALEFSPMLARRLIAQSRYHSAARMPPIVWTVAGYGSAESAGVAALASMWERYLGVRIRVENLDPNTAQDRIDRGQHGQLVWFTWCADYPDPENFADTMYHTGAAYNLGHYANPRLDSLLDRARVEPNGRRRLAMYRQAEDIIVRDAPSIFLTHAYYFELIAPRVRGYPFTPFSTVSLDPAFRLVGP
jgi:oligopeptide transport system substrate-binding protein